MLDISHVLVIKIKDTFICVTHSTNDKATKTGCPPKKWQIELFHDVALVAMWCMYSSIVYVIRISFVGRGSVCSSSQNTVGPICKNPPTIRLKKLWNWLMSATIWHIFSMRHKQWTETEIISIWWNLLEKIREIASYKHIFGEF